MKPTRILIADDHPIVQHGLAAILATHATEWEICGTAGDGEQALREALCYRPNIVIMDYKMPRLNGLAAARQIKQRLPRVETLIFSGATSPRILLEIFHSKVSGSLLKSEAVEELFPALGALRRHHPFRSRGITELCEKIMAGAERYETLTPCERKVLQLIAHGLSIEKIALKAGVSEGTIETHRTNLYRKLNVHSAPEAIGLDRFYLPLIADCWSQILVRR